MNQILTDEEIFKLQYEMQYRDGGFHPIPFARAIEQAILNKLSEQKPVNFMQRNTQVVALYDNPAPSVPEWQPIETAPKDGTVVLLAGCRKPVAAAWLEDEIDYWHVDDNKRGPFALRGPGPTHWMPLPKPPAARSE